MQTLKLSKDPLNIVVCGVGGQGNVLASRLIGKSLSAEGYIVTIGETYGVSQRGGPVMSHIRISRNRAYSPLIPQGRSHIVLGLEPLETLRILGDYGNPEVATIVNTRPIQPVTVGMGAAEYPPYEQLKQAITELSGRIWFVNASEIALELGTPLLTNIVMLGALIGLQLLPVTDEQFENILKEHFSPDKVELNIEAFRKGLRSTQVGS